MRYLLGIILFVSSCGNKPVEAPALTKSTTLKLKHSPAVDYPSVHYDEVALYTVNSKYYKDEHLVPLMHENQNEEKTIGFAILDSSGNPAFHNIDRILLSLIEIQELRSIFHIPENHGELKDKKCIAFFRDAFVFYKDKKQVAQAQICFDCDMIYFLNDTSNLEERFTTDGDWNRLQKFISKVKAP